MIFAFFDWGWGVWEAERRGRGGGREAEGRMREDERERERRGREWEGMDGAYQQSLKRSPWAHRVKERRWMGVMPWWRMPSRCSWVG